MPWLVTVVSIPKENIFFKKGYFPRKTWYKKDALALKKEIELRGGEAKIEKVKK